MQLNSEMRRACCFLHACGLQHSIYRSIPISLLYLYRSIKALLQFPAMKIWWFNRAQRKKWRQQIYDFRYRYRSQRFATIVANDVVRYCLSIPKITNGSARVHHNTAWWY
jgi:hypothetical protein